MPSFAADQITFDELQPDGRALYRVELAGAAFSGRVLVSAARHKSAGTEQWIADELDRFATRTSVNVVRGRLYSPVELD